MKLRENQSGAELLDGFFLDILMYADDIVLLPSSASGLQKHLHTLSDYCKQWELEVNTEKTKITIYGKGADSQTYSWNNVLLEKVKYYKYLGIWLYGKFSRAMEHTSEKSKKAMFSLQVTLKQLGHPPVPIAIQLYNSILKPVMCYGSEIWGFTECKDLDRIELRFLKYILHLPLSALVQLYVGRLDNYHYTSGGKSAYLNTGIDYVMKTLPYI